jgi:hypothetical protein
MENNKLNVKKKVNEFANEVWESIELEIENLVKTRD